MKYWIAFGVATLMLSPSVVFAESHCFCIENTETQEFIKGCSSVLKLGAGQPIIALCQTFPGGDLDQPLSEAWVKVPRGCKDCETCWPSAPDELALNRPRGEAQAAAPLERPTISQSGPEDDFLKTHPQCLAGAQ